jgi:hypothetical protein
MHPRQRVMSIQSVVKCRVQPVRGRVACSAIVRQAQLHMRRILAVCEIGSVARVAGCRSSFEYVVEMACRARQGCVRPRQRVPRILQVIKLRVEPRIHRVAAFTRGRKPRRNVIEYRRQKIFLVARVARCR